MTSTTEDRRFGVNSGQAIKVPCKAATTAPITLDGEQTIDGIACTSGDRVLVKDQADASENGIYVVDTGAWSRAPDFDGADDVVQGTMVRIVSGTQSGDTLWGVTTSGTITPGTTELAFTTAIAVVVTDNLNFVQTTSSDIKGIVYKDNMRFLHDFKHSTGDTVAPDGFNTFVGLEAGNFTMGSTATNVAHGSYNVAVGYRALLFNTTGESNVAVGYRALQDNTTGDYNIGIGRRANHENITGSSNVAVGHGSLFTNTAGSSNIAIGYQSLYSLTTANTNVAVGHASQYSLTTGSNNTAIGDNAARNNTTGIQNVSVGAGCMFNNTGSQNVSMGYQSLYANTGARNVASGQQAFRFNTSGNDGVAAGYRALYNNTTGSNNVALGSQALFTNTTAAQGVAVGYQALYTNNGAANTAAGYTALKANTSGANGTAVGAGALALSTTGDSNTGIGSNALGSNTTGSTNTAVGTDALDLLQSAAAAQTLVNCSGLGYQAAVSGDNQVQLGNSATTTYVYGTVQNRSDERDKADIRDTELGIDFIMKLRPVDYKWDMREDYPGRVRDGTKKRNRYHHGFIAQEVQALGEFGGLQDHSINGGCDVMSLGYDEFIAPLIKAVQQQQQVIEALTSRLEQLEKES